MVIMTDRCQAEESNSPEPAQQTGFREDEPFTFVKGSSFVRCSRKGLTWEFVVIMTDRFQAKEWVGSRPSELLLG